ncbi:MAG: YebC/PmpR family DNA-binding transcriptional regulator [Ectothiorhodospiraceae bacterium]|nr:YebC/PmpR family DNA-binding transcriptional regulator [Ectothiorhodospiraceae bacterium]
MSGHSKWSTIKRAKGAKDAARGKLFSRLIKEITVAARDGGGDADANPRLRLAIDKAKEGNMPNDNIKRAIQRGTGEIEGAAYEENTYEGYGPGGVAFLIETITDNKNRTVAEVRHIFSKYNGNLAENGAVSWKFDRKGIIEVPNTMSEDDLMMVAIEAGAEDIDPGEEMHQIVTGPTDLDSVKKNLEAQGIEIKESSLQMIPQNTIAVGDSEAETIIKLSDALEDHDDVQAVYSDFEIDDAILEKLNAG